MIPIVIGALMLFKAANGQEGVVNDTQMLAPASQSVEQFVREFYEEEPVLADIARCESRFRHYNEKGAVLRGEITSADIGVMQINEGYHGVASKALGFDIRTIEGNLSYARYLFEKEGTRPWNASKGCWKKTLAMATGK